MAIPYRREKLSSQIVKEVSQILLYELKDPRMGFVTVTRAKLSPDLAFARVFVSIMGPEKGKKLTMSALAHARGFVQHALSKRLAIRQCPEIQFARDDSIDKTFKLTQTIERLSKERQAREAGDAEPAAAKEEEE